MQNNLQPYDYKNVRTVIHNILYSFFDHELECSKEQEFDFEFMESKTDEILRLIKRQGGQV